LLAASAKILVVDDIADNRDLLVRRLQRLGIRTISEAANGVEALAALERERYDLMLLDIMMPEMDGFAVLDRLRADGRVDELPVIVISALNEIDAVVRCIEKGAEDFLFKPFNPVLLRARVLASLEKKALRDRTRDELRRKQSELNEARTLQLALAPPPLTTRFGDCAISLQVVLEPAKEIGGDLVDHFHVGDDLLVFLVGDVSNKGAGAALMMARTHAMFRSLAARPDARDLFAEPARAMQLVNAALAEGNAGCMFVTLFLGVLDLAARRLAYVRAGHVPPFHRNGAALTRLRAATDPPLGLVEGFEFHQDDTTLSPGDSLLVVTDGFTEAADADGALFGDERVAAFFESAQGRAGDALASLAQAVHAFEAGQQFDDMAAVLLTLTPINLAPP
jgi:phosphoserine phosphatase RsbU/P